MSSQENARLYVLAKDSKTEFFGYFCPLGEEADALKKIENAFKTCVVEQHGLPGLPLVNMHVAFDANDRPWGIIAPKRVIAEKYNTAEEYNIAIKIIEITANLEAPLMRSAYIARDLSAQHLNLQPPAPPPREARKREASDSVSPAESPARPPAPPPREARKRGASDFVPPAESPARPPAPPPREARKRRASDFVPHLDKGKKRRKIALPPMALPPMALPPMALPPMALPPMALPPMDPLMASFPLPDELRNLARVIPSDVELKWVPRMVPNEHLAAFTPVRLPPQSCPFAPPRGMTFVLAHQLVVDKPSSFSPRLAMVVDQLHPAPPRMTVIEVPVVTPKNIAS